MTWIPLALLGAAFAALVTIFGKIGLQHIDSTTATTIRAVIMALFLVGIAVVFGKLTPEHIPDGKTLLFIALSGVAGALSWLCMFSALKLGPASGVAAVDKLSIVFVVIFSIIFLSVPLSWKAFAGAAMITIGALLLI